MHVISPLFSFPAISWWMQVMEAGSVTFDLAERFQKMTGRNRYRISGSNNAILLTIPLAKGRDQHIAMKDARIFNEERWQVQHWRTLVSVYGRSPYFEHYAHGLRPLYEQQFDALSGFNIAAMEWVKKQLKAPFTIDCTETWQKDYPAGVTDLRKGTGLVDELPRYYQVFEDRIGFIRDLSILDLLFSEGPAAAAVLGRR